MLVSTRCVSARDVLGEIRCCREGPGQGLRCLQQGIQGEDTAENRMNSKQEPDQQLRDLHKTLQLGVQPPVSAITLGSIIKHRRAKAQHSNVPNSGDRLMPDGCSKSPREDGPFVLSSPSVLEVWSKEWPRHFLKRLVALRCTLCCIPRHKEHGLLSCDPKRCVGLYALCDRRDVMASRHQVVMQTLCCVYRNGQSVET